MIAALFGLILFLIYIGILLFFVMCGWKVFVKAGQPGWGCIIPIYNIYLWLQIAGRPGWWLILYLIPFVNLVIAIIVSLDIAKRFGKGTGFGILLILLPIIALPILAFGSAVYTKPAAAPAPAA